MIRYLMAAIVLVLMTTNLFSQECLARVLLNSGAEMEVSIVSVEIWGFTLADNRTILFRVVNKVTTKDTLLVHEVLAVVDSVHVRTEGELQELDFLHATFQPLPERTGGGLSMKSVAVGVLNDHAMNYRVQLDFSFHGLYPFVLSPAISGGKTNNDNTTVSGSIGAGVLLEYETHNLMVLMNYTNHSVETLNIDDKDFATVSLSIEDHVHLFSNSRIILMVGAHYNLNHIDYDGTKQRFGVKVGLGYNLSNGIL